MALPLVLVASSLVGCSARSDADAGDTTTTAAESEATTSTDPSSVAELEDGPIEPGRYRHLIESACEPGMLDCSLGPSSPPTIEVEVTVPEGWEAAVDYNLIHPASAIDVDAATGPTTGPDGAGLLLGWTTFWVGFNSDPCAPKGSAGVHQVPDIAVGPTVDDFIGGVVNHPSLDVTEPTEVELGRHRASFFTLTAPSDLSDCDRWRAWDPNIYAQGPDNQWDVWAVDVDGFRVVILAQSFPDTPADVKAQLREMVESMELRLADGDSA